MSEKDTEIEKIQKNNSKKDSQGNNSIVIFNFSSLKQNANLIVSDYNLFKYDFNTKTILELNSKINPSKLTDNKNINKNQNLNLLKSLNLEFPSSEKLSQANFHQDFMDNYETSFANFCEIDKNIFTKAYVNKRYKPYLDKFGNIKISIKNLTDLLKLYSPSLKLKIRRRFIKKYKRKRIFKTMKSLTKTGGELESLSGTNYNPSLNTEGLKLISLKKNLKITVKKNSDNKNNDIIEKDNNPEGCLDFNSNNNLLNNINLLNNECILSNNLLKSSIFSFRPPSNNIIQGTDNIFNFSFNNEQNQNYFNFNNINNINNINAQLTNNMNNMNNINNINNINNMNNTMNNTTGNNMNNTLNNNMNNNINNNINNNYMLQMNPLERHIYSSNFNSNELVFKQPFSLNTSFYYKNNKNNLFSSNSEPKEKQIINLDDIARGIEKRTTVMIRNVPIKYTVEVLEKELDYFNGKFDCLYMPFDYENGGNKGYAFLNLVNPYHVLLFYEVFHGKCWSFFESKKICELNFANFQGINEIKKHAKNYKGTKKPTFYINTNISNSCIEVPKKYLYLILEKNPNLKYYENKMLNTIIINSFN